MGVQPNTPASAGDLRARYPRVRGTTLELAAGLSPEDAQLQSMPDASPAKWHLAHVTWFFEQFVLIDRAGRQPVNAAWLVLFNSYYASVGPRHARPQRGLLSRPSLAEVVEYRQQVDAAMLELLACEPDPATLAMVELGLNHEQQHQELLLTDILHAFAQNPVEPAFGRLPAAPPSAPVPLSFRPGPEGLAHIGHAGDAFALDCETPRHRVVLHPHAIANRPVTNGEYRQFIEDGGYSTPLIWLAEGWNAVQHHGWERPLYWSADLETSFTLGGRLPLDTHAPVAHLSFHEADAFARWAGCRLPTEAEWEARAATESPRGNLLDSGHLRPLAAAADDAADGDGVLQMFGDVWEWTASPYVAYPGYRPWAGAVGEYNGKFMSGQWVLRGGSCATPADHIRATYRNFFYPADRWQFSGLRLAKDA